MNTSGRSAPHATRIESEISTDARRELMSSPWVGSWVGASRPGDTSDSDPRRRASAWAQWAVSNLVEIDNGERAYPALMLPAKFYDPGGTGPDIVPHLEIPARVMSGNDSEFPRRLAHCGNGLRFPYWLYGEVVALRRAVFNTPPGPAGEFFDILDERAGGIRDGLTALTRYCEPLWPEVASEIIGDGMVEEATGDFSAAEVSSWLPAAAEFDLHIRFDARMREREGSYASRRIGVWQVRGTTPGGDPFGFGVITPRLTKNSLFTDPLFSPGHEALAAALVRSLLLRRFINTRLGGGRLVKHRIGDPVPVAPRPTKRAHGYLKAVVAKPGQKLPEASLGAAAAFIATHPDADQAWRELTEWADRGFLLTVTQEAFRSAHRRASRALRRAEEPDRTDVDALLPLAWDSQEGKAQVVRATWVKGVLENQPH